eukprot:4107619-Pleurochrysis_carterae.AAC.1
MRERAIVVIWPGCQPLKSAIDIRTGAPSGHAPGSLYTARRGALRRYSLKHFGTKAVHSGGESTNLQVEPKALFKLKARPDHANYPELNL